MDHLYEVWCIRENEIILYLWMTDEEAASINKRNSHITLKLMAKKNPEDCDEA